jgi:imidazolonepropionase-like amidohydrolase
LTFYFTLEKKKTLKKNTSHMGVDSWPELAGTDDTNEMTQPLTPFVRTLDAFNPSDKAIRIVSSGGVTTALVLPGSGNLMGGEAFVFKLRQVDTLSNDDMLAQANIDEQQDTKWRWMKMACGENPKVCDLVMFTNVLQKSLFCLPPQ